MHFEIQHDSRAGYYLYVWENGKGLYDYLQDTFAIAVDQAFEEFGVPKNSWKQIPETQDDKAPG
ncbi:MAG: hypothetical protein WC521_02850 [Bdellovibrionales bacterium]